MHAAPKRRPTGVTLVEMLVVITIIGILASLAIPAVFSAIVTAKVGRIAMEISQLDAAMVQYKTLTGSYPPDFSLENVAATGDSNREQIDNHLLRRFPRRNNDPLEGRNNNPPQEAEVVLLDPAEALVFWLSGFSSNPIRPLSDVDNRKPLFEFDKSRLKDLDTDGWPEYYPQDGNDAPYVYFNAATYILPPPLPTTQATYSKASIPGRATPYVSDFGTTTEPHVNAKTCQIISAGLDGDYGGFNTSGSPVTFSYPRGVDASNGTYLKADRDNITNFSRGTLGDRQEEAE